jgi:hypothetical protein
MPVLFMKAANDYCWVTRLGVRTKCNASVNLLQIYVVLTADLGEGDIYLELYGLQITSPGSNLFSSFRLITTTSGGTIPTISDFFVDISEPEAFVVTFDNHPSGRNNQFSYDVIRYGSDDKSALSFFELNVLLGMDKRIYQNDFFRINMGSANTAVASAPVWCQILNSKD